MSQVIVKTLTYPDYVLKGQAPRQNFIISCQCIYNPDIEEIIDNKLSHILQVIEEELKHNVRPIPVKSPPQEGQLP